MMRECIFTLAREIIPKKLPKNVECCLIVRSTNHDIYYKLIYLAENKSGTIEGEHRHQHIRWQHTLIPDNWQIIITLFNLLDSENKI